MTTHATPAGPPVHPSLARSVSLRLFLALRQLVDGSRLMEVRDAHLAWILEQERSGRLFLAGPAKTCGGKIPLSGLMIFRAGNADEAHAIAVQDPFVVEGLMTVEICEWTVFEGSLTMNVNLSDSSIRL